MSLTKTPEIPHPADSENTAITQFKIKITEIPHKKLTNTAIPQTPMSPSINNSVNHGIFAHWTQSVDSFLARQSELPESTKDDIRNTIASTLQSASLTDCNSTKDELHALKWLKNHKYILPADKGRVTVVMDMKDWTDEMDSLVNDKQTHEPLKRDPTPSLQRRLNGKLLDLKKTETIDI